MTRSGCSLPSQETVPPPSRFHTVSQPYSPKTSCNRETNTASSSTTAIRTITPNHLHTFCKMLAQSGRRHGVLAMLDIHSRRAASFRSCSEAIVVVETTHDRQGDDGLAALGHIWLPLRYARNCLVDSLLWTGMIDVVHVLLKDALEMTVVDDEDMVYTLPTNTPQEALADGIGPRRTDRSPEDLNPARCSDADRNSTRMNSS